MRGLALTTLVLLIPTLAEASAFGISAGDRIDKYSPELHSAPNNGVKSAVITPPEPSAFFITYRAYYTDQTGICRVVAVSSVNENDKWGVAVKRNFEDISNALSAKYGNPKSADFLRKGSIWNTPESYSAALSKGERVKMAIWERSSESRIPSDVAAIAIEEKAVDLEDTFLKITYDFSNAAECAKISDDAQSRGL